MVQPMLGEMPDRGRDKPVPSSKFSRAVPLGQRDRPVPRKILLLALLVPGGYRVHPHHLDLQCAEPHFR